MIAIGWQRSWNTICIVLSNHMPPLNQPQTPSFWDEALTPSNTRARALLSACKTSSLLLFFYKGLLPQWFASKNLIHPWCILDPITHPNPKSLFFPSQNTPLGEEMGLSSNYFFHLCWRWSKGLSPELHSFDLELQ